VTSTLRCVLVADFFPRWAGQWVTSRPREVAWVPVRRSGVSASSSRVGGDGGTHLCLSHVLLSLLLLLFFSTCGPNFGAIGLVSSEIEIGYAGMGINDYVIMSKLRGLACMQCTGHVGLV
jgi:hypothetical protein